MQSVSLDPLFQCCDSVRANPAFFAKVVDLSGKKIGRVLNGNKNGRHRPTALNRRKDYELRTVKSDPNQSVKSVKRWKFLEKWHLEDPGSVTPRRRGAAIANLQKDNRQLRRAPGCLEIAIRRLDWGEILVQKVATGCGFFLPSGND